MVTGLLGPDRKNPMPQRILDAQGWRETEEEERIEKEKWDAHQEVVDKLRPLAEAGSSSADPVCESRKRSFSGLIHNGTG